MTDSTTPTTSREQKRGTITVRDKRDTRIFIHSELDDYPLTLVEFRVYARLARRSGQIGAFESVPNMAQSFGVSDRTVQRALRLLTLAHLIEEHRRPGRTTIYNLLPHGLWLPAKALAELREELAQKSTNAHQIVKAPKGYQRTLAAEARG